MEILKNPGNYIITINLDAKVIWSY